MFIHQASVAFSQLILQQREFFFIEFSEVTFSDKSFKASSIFFQILSLVLFVRQSEDTSQANLKLTVLPLQVCKCRNYRNGLQRLKDSFTFIK